MVWTSIKLRHDVPILELINYARDDLRKQDFGVYIQPVQHHDVICMGWLLFLHGNSEIPFWQNLFDNELQEKHHERGLIGLQSKAPIDGIKKTPFITGTLQEIPSKALHVEVQRDQSDVIKNNIKDILKQQSFKRFTTTRDIQRVPQYNWNQGKVDKNRKIKI